MVAQRGIPALNIIAGEFRGRALRYPEGRILRPTMQRTREALFSSIEAELHGVSFFDLYAGAGSVGIEALSRGASTVSFVENNSDTVRFLRENLVACAIDPSQYDVHAVTVEAFLTPEALGGCDDVIVFADPPYDGAGAANVLELFDRTAYPNVKLLVIEHGKPLGETGLLHLELTKSKRYGDARLSYFSPAGEGK